MSETAVVSTPVYRDLPLAVIRESSWNPRKHFNLVSLDELAASIREKGVIEPIVVRPRGQRRGDDPEWFEIVAGARRFRASKATARGTIPALVCELDDVAALELAVIENQQRDDVHPLDEAEGYQALAKADKKFTPAIIAAKVGKSESYIYRRLKLLTLEPALRQALTEDRLTVAHADKLLRLPPKLRAEASHSENGVVWRHSPLLDYSDKWVPSRDDLRPLSDLENFIRTRSSFDPAARETRHLQPELADALDDAVEDLVDGSSQATGGEAIDETEVLASIVSLSEDPMARSRMRLAKGDAAPLTPSKWREIKREKDRCAFVVKGAITHGGTPRIIDVCTERSCQQHFPVAKKKASKARRGPAPKPQEDYNARWAREDKARKETARIWAAVQPQACELVKAHLAKVKFGVPMLQVVLSGEGNELAPIADIKDMFRLSLTPTTAALFLALSTLVWDDAESFARSVTPWRFDLKPVSRLLAAEEKKSTAAAAPPDSNDKSAKKKGAKA